MKTLLIFAILALVATPIQKVGDCPVGYATQQDYCMPTGSATFAVKKVGNCPVGYFTSGDYCVANDEKSKFIIPKKGNCPSGFRSSGDYCIGF